MAEIVRILRVLEYVGTREWVDDMINLRSVKGRHDVAGNYIQEAIIGETPEVIKQGAANDDAS